MGICAGIVTYNPDILRLECNIQALYENGIKEIYIVDNNSINKKDVKESVEKLKIANVIYFNENKGIATALNKILEIALQNKFQWCITMDQDSVLPESFVHEAQPFLSTDVGLVCPCSEESEISNSHSKGIIEQSRCITSGAITSVEAWQHCGGFDELLFIDYVDFDFCVRIRVGGYHIYKMTSFLLDHQLGNVNIKIFLGKQIPIYNHSPKRTYFFVRNGIIFIKKNHSYICVTKECYTILRWVLIKILFEGNKIQTVKSFFTGFIDGIRYKKRGKNNEI